MRGSRGTDSTFTDWQVSLTVADLEGGLPRLFFFFFFINLFIYLFLAVLGLLCCTRACSSGGERGLLFVAVRGLLIAVASFVAEHGL